MWKNGSTAIALSRAYSSSVLRESAGVGALSDVRNEVPVREHHALGEPGGAARVRQRDQVVGGVDLTCGGSPPALHQRCERRRASRPRRRRRSPRRLIVGRRACLLEQLGHGHQQPRAGVHELSGELVHGHQRVCGRVHAACRRDPVERDRVLGQVRGVMGEHVALAEAALGQTGRQPAHGFDQLGVGDRPPARAVDQRRLVAPLAAALKDEVRERQVRNLNVRKRAADHTGTLLVEVGRVYGRSGKRADLPGEVVDLGRRDLGNTPARNVLALTSRRWTRSRVGRLPTPCESQQERGGCRRERTLSRPTAPTFASCWPSPAGDLRTSSLDRGRRRSRWSIGQLRRSGTSCGERGDVAEVRRAGGGRRGFG